MCVKPQSRYCELQLNNKSVRPSVTDRADVTEIASILHRPIGQMLPDYGTKDGGGDS